MNASLFAVLPSCQNVEEPGVVSVQYALDAMLNAVSAVAEAERVQLASAVGRALAAPIVAPLDVPGHTNSAVDGYALAGGDLPGPGEIKEFSVIGSALAGHPYRGVVAAKGQCVRIMTGAVMPEGTDTVIMQEDVQEQGERIRVDGRHEVGQNVRQAGEDIRRGETVLTPGRWLTPADVGLAASLGYGELTVHRRLRVAVLTTGDELQTLGTPPASGFLYDSNRHMLTAALRRLGVETLDQGIVRDDPKLLERSLRAATADADVVISTGGVSVGAADYVKQVLGSLGEIQLWKVAMKPGRPIAFGRIGEATFFGLPGNPVAVLVTYYQFVRPVLEKRMGIRERPVIPHLPARSRVRLRKKPGRTEFQRGVLESSPQGEWWVKTTGKQGSGILRSMSLANALIVLPAERGMVEPGEWVDTVPFAALI
jgi:molybdopterin molybdotransferase